MNSSLISNTNTNNSNTNASNNGLVINVIHIKGSEVSNVSSFVEKVDRKKSNRDIQIKTDTKNVPSQKTINSATNKHAKNVNISVTYENTQLQKTPSSGIPVMKANLTSIKSSPKPMNSAAIPPKPNMNNISIALSTSNSNNANKTFLSNSSMLKKDLKIPINIKSLDRARDNYRQFKEKLNKVSQNMTTENLNDNLKKNIQEILTDHSQNQYMLSANDQSVIKKLQEVINFQQQPIIISRSSAMEEKTRSNSFNFCDGRNLNEDLLAKQDTKNEQEILSLLNNKKFGRLTSDRVNNNSEHQRNTMFYKGSNAYFF